MQSVEYGRGYDGQFAYFRARWREAALTRPGPKLLSSDRGSWTRGCLSATIAKAVKTGQSRLYQLAAMSGSGEFASNRESSAPNVRHQRFLYNRRNIGGILCGHDDKGRIRDGRISDASG